MHLPLSKDLTHIRIQQEQYPYSEDQSLDGQAVTASKKVQEVNVPSCLPVRVFTSLR
jgi:hypothetical protein